jgi:ABC-2 type transport system ATP-binding protein
VDKVPLLVEGFGRRYKRNRPWAVRNASFTLPNGSITALVGPNGAGKSTLIRSCIGFERPDEGRVLVFGVDPSRTPAVVVGKVGYVPQAASLYRGLTVADHLTIALAARPTFDRTSAIVHLAAVGLAPKRVVGELSGGEQAQVALALALGTRAELLLLDEPLASLDPLARRDFLARLVVDVRERGATAVLTSHIVGDVEQVCDRLVVLGYGRIILDSSIELAKAEYSTIRASELAGQDAVGFFSGPQGEQLALIRSAQSGNATLEEIVLGHLASVRRGRAEAA